MSDLAERIFEKALTAVRGRDYGKAKALLVECIKLKPDFYEAWIVRGNIFHSDDQPFEALLHYDRALSIKDTIHDAWNNRGLAFADIGLFAEAERSFKRSLELLPALEPHMGLANMYCSIMKLENAANEYREAIKINPGLYDAHFNLGVTLLGLGQWEEGWQEYRYRLQNTPYPPRWFRNYPQWNGEDLTGKRIILYPEQGSGDEILALRFADVIASLFHNVYVIIAARSPMYRLAKSMNKMVKASSITCTNYNTDDNIQADFACPLLDVPMLVGMDYRQVQMGQYLMPPYNPHQELYDWSERLKNLPNPKALNVGLCWSSGGHLDTARVARLAKSIPIEHLRTLLAVPNVNFISLQKPKESIPSDLPIVDWTDDLHDFADTAALIDDLDLVISVDTAVAHLAGALGKPVWNFVRYSGYWPWLAPQLLEQHHAIWYSSMRLLRQPALFDWQEPLKTAAQWLRQKRKI